MYRVQCTPSFPFQRIPLTSVADPYADPTYHFDADPDLDPDFYLMRMRIRMRIRILASNKRLKPWKKCSNRLLIHTFLACHLQIDADPDPTYHFDADPDPDFYFMGMRIRIWIRVLKTMDPDPQHCPPYFPPPNVGKLINHSPILIVLVSS